MSAVGRRPTLVGSIAVAAVLGWVSYTVCAADAPPLGASRALMVDLEEALVCQCGCGLTVHACNHLNCPSGIPMKEEIAKRLARGETREQIIAYFRDRYGEKVLSAPTLTGFNIVAWVAPFVFLVVGGVVVTRVARRWLRETEAHRAPMKPAAIGDEYRERLAREIDEFDG